MEWFLISATISVSLEKLQQDFSIPHSFSEREKFVPSRSFSRRNPCCTRSPCSAKQTRSNVPISSSEDFPSELALKSRKILASTVPSKASLKVHIATRTDRSKNTLPRRAKRLARDGRERAPAQR